MNKVFIFGIGAAVGSLLTWKLIEKKYKDLADEEIQSVIDRFNERAENESRIVEVKTFNKPIENPKIEVVKDDYKKLSQDLGYNVANKDEYVITEDDNGSIFLEPAPKEDQVAPYVITPEEFGDNEMYVTKSWTYYSDHIITDEMGCIVGDPEYIIGDALEHFGEYEDDSVHVRNENTECDYEIIKIEESFAKLNADIKERMMSDNSTRD